MSCDDIFDPDLQAEMQNSRWMVDFSLNSIDSDGWTYAFDFATLNKTGAGDIAPKWNSYVRRRKWRYVDKSGSGSAELNEVKSRIDARKDKAAAQSKNAGKIPANMRNQNQPLTGSGFSNGGMLRGKKDADQELDEESAAGLAAVKAKDAEIDAGIAVLANTVDNLDKIAKTMGDETKNQNRRLEQIENKMQKVTEKTTVVNARQVKLLGSN
jgi:hypothetical protein